MHDTQDYSPSLLEISDMVFGSLLKNIFEKVISKVCSVWYNKIRWLLPEKTD